MASWTDGCIKTGEGTYKHCGGNCGDDLKYGGGTPINGMDECCRAHDRCWKKFGKKDPCCDDELIKCSTMMNFEDPILGDLIRTYFKSNANKC